jgi:DNA polymerase-1
MPEHNMDPEHVLAWLRDTLGNPNQPKIGANLIYDVGWLEHEGVPVRGMLYDVQFAEALLDETALTNLDTLGEKYLGIGKEKSALNRWSWDYYGGKEHEQRSNLYRCPPCLVGPYAEADTDLPQRILPLQWARLEQEGLLELFIMECRLVPLLIAMRRGGVTVDINKTERVRERLVEEVKTLNERIRYLVGFDVNVNAPESMQKAFQRLSIPIPTNAKGGRTFNKEALAAIEHPFVELVLEQKKIVKVSDTFLKSYVLDSNVGGKIFCEFHPLRSDRGGTRSGRFASSNPNLQNVPSRDEYLAPLVRGVFIPHEGHYQWRRYDYSQVEYRCLAHDATGGGAEALRAQYNADPDTDYHVWTQKLVENMLGMVIKRKPIKTINFGLIYGMGKDKLTRSLGLDKRAGEELFNAYHEAAPFASSTMNHYSDMASRYGFVSTILGRRSRFNLWEPDLRGRSTQPALPYQAALNKYGKVKRAMTHKALNRRLQGSAADMMKKAMLVLWDSGVLDYTGVPTLTVHDELDFSDPGGCDDAFDYVKRVMETALPMRIPIRADVEVGPSWGEAH